MTWKAGPLYRRRYGIWAFDNVADAFECTQSGSYIWAHGIGLCKEAVTAIISKRLNRAGMHITGINLFENVRIKE